MNYELRITCRKALTEGGASTAFVIHICPIRGSRSSYLRLSVVIQQKINDTSTNHVMEGGGACKLNMSVLL